LSQALLASTAIPVLFDPVELTFGGVTSQYIDGGIADNTPIDLARILAKNVYSVLVDPQHAPHALYPNAVEIGLAAFGVAQRRIFEKALRTASLESEPKRLLLPTATAAGRAVLEEISHAQRPLPSEITHKVYSQGHQREHHMRQA
jgi:predicted acylesterase/phospholipase RssA